MSDLVERLRNALVPFGEAVESLHDEARDTDSIWESPAAMSLTVGDLRRAADALAAVPSPGKAVEALKKARPIVEEAARWHRDIQSPASKTASAYKVLAGRCGMSGATRYWISVCAGSAVAAGSLAFIGGVEFSRGQIRAMAEELSTQPTNSFSRCLTEMWEITGELDPEWKGERRWQLLEPRP